MKNTTDQTLQFALCLNNEGYPASLEIGKLYRVVPDEEAAAHGYIRIIDESGKDYAFTAHRFHVMHLPHAVGQALLAASRTWLVPHPRRERGRMPGGGYLGADFLRFFPLLDSWRRRQSVSGADVLAV